MTDAGMIAANAVGMSIFFGGIAACVRFDQQGKTRRREIEHIERMRAIELGQPLDDATVARHQAAGAIGVAVPIASLSAAVLGSCFAFVAKSDELRTVVWAVVWVVCGSVAGIAVWVASQRLRDAVTPEKPPF